MSTSHVQKVKSTKVKSAEATSPTPTGIENKKSTSNADRQQFEKQCKEHYENSGEWGCPDCVDAYIDSLKERWPQFTSEPITAFQYYDWIWHQFKNENGETVRRKMSFYEGLLQTQKDYEKDPPLRLIRSVKEEERLRRWPHLFNGEKKTGSNPHGHKSDMMKSGIAGENKGNCQMSGAPFYNDFERKIVTEHIAKWPDDKPEHLGQFLASVQQGGGLITKSSTLEVMHRDNPIAGTFLLAYLLKAAKISIVLHLQLKEDNGRNVMCNIRDSSYLGFPASQFGLTEHCSVANFKLWIDTKIFPDVCKINNEKCILDFDITETGKVLKIFVCLISDD